MNAGNLVARLAARHAAPAWAFFPEFRESTGHDVRTLDALAVALYPSLGLEVHGFEVKVARADLARELKDLSKSDAVARFCNRFWLVVPDADVLGPLEAEVPATWGIYVAHGDALRARRKAEKLPGIAAAHVRGFVASLARRVGNEEAVPKKDFDRLVDERVKAKVEEDRRFYEQQAGWRLRDAQRELAAAEETLKKFRDAVGHHISSWNAEDIGAAVRVILESNNAEERARNTLERCLRDLEGACAPLRKALAPECEKRTVDAGGAPR